MANLIVGDARRFGAKFLDFNKAAADPTTVTFEVKNPSGDITTYTGSEITRDSVGSYWIIILFDEPGEWHVEWQGTGAIQKVASDSFYVDPQRIIPE